MTPQELKDEINNDPANLGYAANLAEGDHNGIAIKLNTKSYTGYKPLESKTALMWSAKAGTYIKLVLGAEAQNLQVQHICKSALKLLDRDGTTLDLNEPDFMTFIDALVAAGVFSSADKQSLLETATESQSRAEKLFGRNTTITHEQISEALKVE
jgi:hypothetical protein